MAKTSQELQALGESQSRIEKIIDFICGKSTDINLLPKPQSRIEEQLEYIAYNLRNILGSGGGSIQSPSNASQVPFTEGSTGLGNNVQNAIENINNKFDNYAKLDSSNIFTENNRFNNLEVNDMISTTYLSLDNSYISNTLIGDRKLVIKANEYVKELYVHIRDNHGATVTNVSVFTLTKGTTRQQDIIKERLASNQTYNVLIDNYNNKYIKIPINRTFNEDVYIGLLFKDNTGIKSALQNNGDDTLFCQNVYENTITLNTEIPPLASYTWKANMCIFIYRDIKLKIKDYINNTNKDLKINKKTVFDRSDNIWNASYFRIPSLLRTPKGTLLSFADIRYNTPHDQSFIDIGVARSTDNGFTWNYNIAIKNDGVNQTYSRVMDNTSLVTKEGKIFVLGGSWATDTGNWSNETGTPDDDWNPYLVESEDDGITWINKRSLKSSINNQPNPNACQNQPEGTVAWLGGVGTGIQMKDNTLVFPIQITYYPNYPNTSSKVTKSGIIYSKDNGNTWTMCSNFVTGSECMVVEADGGLILNARNGSNKRTAYITKDLGATEWSEYTPLNNIISNGANGCQGSFITYKTISGHRVGLISTPKNLKGGYIRDNITIYMIDFDSKNKNVEEILIPYPYDGNPSGGGYSSLSFGNTIEGKRVLEIVYEANGNIEYQDISYLLDEIEDKVNKHNWESLDYVNVVRKYTFNNLVNTITYFDNRLTTTIGRFDINNNWKVLTIPVEYGKTYCFMNKRGDTIHNQEITGTFRCNEYNVKKQGTQGDNDFSSRTFLVSRNYSIAGSINGRTYLSYTPSDTNVTHITIDTYKPYSDVYDEFMVWEASVTPHTTYINPGGQDIYENISINGDYIDISYSDLDGFSSTTVKGMLDELGKSTFLLPLKSNKGIGTDNNFGGGRIIGNKEQSSGVFENGYVEKLVIYLRSTNATTLSNIKLYAVNKSNNQVTNIINDNLSCNVLTNVDGIKYIELPVKMVFNDDTYFVYLLPSGTSTSTNYHSLSGLSGAVLDKIINMDGNTNLTMGSSVDNSTRKTYTIYSEIHGKISTKDKINVISSKIDNIMLNAIKDININLNTNIVTLTRMDNSTVENQITT